MSFSVVTQGTCIDFGLLHNGGGMGYLPVIFLGIGLLFCASSRAEDRCTETSCVQSHVSTTGSNYFALSCVAQFANHNCEGRPLHVDVNRCVDSRTLLMTHSLDEKGEATHPGECGARTQSVRVDCEKACEKADHASGFCDTRRLNCFQQWRQSGYCHCTDR